MAKSNIVQKNIIEIEADAAIRKKTDQILDQNGIHGLLGADKNTKVKILVEKSNYTTSLNPV